MITKLIWATVLNLPDCIDANTTFFGKRINLMAVSKISLKAMMMVKMSGTNPLYQKMKRIPRMRILSAIGSKIFPKLEVMFHFLAKYPSKKSVTAAMTNMPNDMAMSVGLRESA